MGTDVFHKFREKVLKQKGVIDALNNREDDDGIQMYFEERERLNELLLHEETYWKQRAKTFWLQEGNTNSRFFHASASSRNKMNHIAALKADDGSLVSNHDDLCRLLKSYYVNVFSASDCINRHTQVPIQASISTEQNNMLTASLTFQEFTNAVRSMHPDKASGPDGLNPAFF